MVAAPKRKILIVDNDVLSVIQAEQVLSQASYAVVKLLGSSGLFAKMEYERPDVVLLNIAMPGLQPEAVFERLREGGFEDLVLVLFSDKSPEDLQQICLENDLLNGYFSKAIDIRQLPDFIESFF